MGAIEDYHLLLAGDPGSALEQAEALPETFSRSGITFGGAPMATFLRPHFVGASAWVEVRDASRRLLEIAERVARQAFDGDARRLCAYLGTPEGEVPWATHDPGPPDLVLSRVDGFLAPRGPRFIEVNSDAPAGFGYGDRMAEVFRGFRVFQEFSRAHDVRYVASVPALVDAVRAVARRRGVGAPRTAVIDWADVKTRADQEILLAALRAAGLRSSLVDPRDLVVSGGRLVGPDGPIDLVYRRLVLSEAVARSDELGAFFRAYREGLAVFVNSFRCRLSEDKAFLALLSDEAFDFVTPDERAFLDRYVPWTRKVEERHTLRLGREIDLLAFALDERAELVLKPAHEYGGRSVLVGAETESSVWEAAVLDARGEPWVLQERVTIPTEPFPVLAEGRLTFEDRKVNVNPFYVAGAGAGAVTRVSTSSVINVSAGGGSVPTFVVEGPI